MPNKRYTKVEKTCIYNRLQKGQKPGRSVIFVTDFQDYVILIRPNDITFLSGDTPISHANSGLKNDHDHLHCDFVCRDPLQVF